MHVGGEDRPLHHPVRRRPGGTAHPGLGRRPAVAHAGDRAAERTGVGAENGGAHVVLEAGQSLGEPVEQWIAHELADRAGGLRDGGHVEQSEAGHAAAVGDGEPLAEHLHAGADREDRHPAGDGALHAGRPGEVPRGEHLGGVLAAAHGVEIAGVRHLVVEGDAHDLGVVPAPAQPLPQDQRVAVVAVRAHDVGQDEADPHGGLGRPGGIRGDGVERGRGPGEWLVHRCDSFSVWPGRSARSAAWTARLRSRNAV